MKTHKLQNSELGLSLNFFHGSRKNERVFVAKEIMGQLGYKGGNDTLRNYNLVEGVDRVTLKKKDYPEFFKQLSDLKSIGHRTATIIMLYESGVWKLVMQSKKQIGIKTRNWLASEVLPSIRQKGYYDVTESESNPLSYLHDFTERNKQIQNSKAVAGKALYDNESFSKVYNEIHRLVTNMTASQIKKNFASKQSARELLRKHMPEHAATEAVLDEIYTKHDKSLKQIEKSNAHKTLPPAFKSLYELGIKF